MTNQKAVIKLGYSLFVLPIEDGIEIVKLFASAEEFKSEYDKDQRKIIPLERDNFIELTFMNEAEYSKYKTQTLLLEKE